MLYSLSHWLGTITSIPLTGLLIKSSIVTTDCGAFEWQVFANFEISSEDIVCGTIWYPDKDIPEKYIKELTCMRYLSLIGDNVKTYITKST